jgi:hypothetical protein
MLAVFDDQRRFLHLCFLDRPYGEFIPGSNTLGKGEFDIILDGIRDLRPSDGSKPTKNKKKSKKKVHHVLL